VLSDALSRAPGHDVTHRVGGARKHEAHHSTLPFFATFQSLAMLKVCYSFIFPEKKNRSLSRANSFPKAIKGIKKTYLGNFVWRVTFFY
jgi:hypothetical protein